MHPERVARDVVSVRTDAWAPYLTAFSSLILNWTSRGQGEIGKRVACSLGAARYIDLTPARAPAFEQLPALVRVEAGAESAPEHMRWLVMKRRTAYVSRGRDCECVEIPDRRGAQVLGKCIAEAVA